MTVPGYPFEGGHGDQWLLPSVLTAPSDHADQDERSADRLDAEDFAAFAIDTDGRTVPESARVAPDRIAGWPARAADDGVSLVELRLLGLSRPDPELCPDPMFYGRAVFGRSEAIHGLRGNNPWLIMMKTLTPAGSPDRPRQVSDPD